MNSGRYRCLLASLCIANVLFLHLFSGKLAKGAVLKAICAGFQETTEPAVCLSEGPDLSLSSFVYFLCSSLIC